MHSQSLGRKRCLSGLVLLRVGSVESVMAHNVHMFSIFFCLMSVYFRQKLWKGTKIMKQLLLGG
jgi:hypothetical protein